MPTKKANTEELVAQAASDFQEKLTGFKPKSVTACLDNQTLVITLHGVLTPAEQALAASPEGAAKVQEFHRQLFATSSEPFRREIKRITGMNVQEADLTPADVTVHSFTTGTMVQVFQLAKQMLTGKPKSPVHDSGISAGSK